MLRKEVSGRIPYADELEDPEKESRSDIYRQKYLESVLKKAGEEYGLSEELSEKALNLLPNY
ncbi:MAG: hypothetical protein ABEJ93_00160 [Candidatus Nanohalobium sp.]